MVFIGRVFLGGVDVAGVVVVIATAIVMLVRIIVNIGWVICIVEDVMLYSTFVVLLVIERSSSGRSSCSSTSRMLLSSIARLLILPSPLLLPLLPRLPPRPHPLLSVTPRRCCMRMRCERRCDCY